MDRDYQSLMYARDTVYKLAKTPADYKLIHDFCKAESAHPLREKEGLPDYVYQKIQRPSIYGLRDGKVVGIICTRESPKWGWAANPCHVAYDIPNHVPVLIRLIDAYEEELRKRQIPHYKILMPSYKPSARKIFELHKNAILFSRSADKRLNVYIVPVVS